MADSTWREPSIVRLIHNFQELAFIYSNWAETLSMLCQPCLMTYLTKACFYFCCYFRHSKNSKQISYFYEKSILMSLAINLEALCFWLSQSEVYFYTLTKWPPSSNSAAICSQRRPQDRDKYKRYWFVCREENNYPYKWQHWKRRSLWNVILMWPVITNKSNAKKQP